MFLIYLFALLLIRYYSYYTRKHPGIFVPPCINVVKQLMCFCQQNFAYVNVVWEGIYMYIYNAPRTCMYINGQSKESVYIHVYVLILLFLYPIYFYFQEIKYILNTYSEYNKIFKYFILFFNSSKWIYFICQYLTFYLKYYFLRIIE